MISLSLPDVKTINVEIINSDTLITKTKYVYERFLSLEDVRRYYSQRLGYKQIIAYYSNFESARINEGILR